MSQPAPLGVGMDIEECAALAHLDRPALDRAARRWLTPLEHEWWASQAAAAESLVVILSCKEAAFKACPTSRAMHQVSLALRGSPERGRARVLGESAVIEVEWGRWEGRVVSLAVARAQ